jgi:hypothetical protein
MEKVLLNLANAAAGVEGTAGSGQALSASGSAGLFSALLCRAIDEGQKAGASSASASSTGQAQAPVDLADLLSALLGNTGNGLAERLQSMAESNAGRTGGTGQTGGETTGSGTGASSAPAGGLKGTADTTEGKTASGAKGEDGASQDLQSLFMGLLALVIKDNGAAQDTSDTTSSDGGQSENTTADAAGSTQTSGASGTDNTSKQDSQSILQALGLLLFAGLEAAAAAQGGAAATSEGTTDSGASQGGSEAKGAWQQAKGAGEAKDAWEAKATPSSAQPAAGPTTDAASTTKDANAAILPQEETNVSSYATAATERQAAQDGQTATFRAELTSTPSTTDGDAGKNGVTLTIKAPFSIIGRAHESAGAQGASGAGAAASQDGQNGDGSAMSTIVKELTPLMDSGDGTTSGDGGTGKEKSGDKEEAYPLTPDGTASAANATGQDQRTTGTTSASGSIERFDRVIEQLAGRTGSHDLTVRLTLDNQASLVLGLKDLGQTVTVDVRSSDQGMIGLLQSQKDAIVQHLDNQDIHAQIVIDPNASGTQEQKERQQDARQRTFTPRTQADSAFGAFLETFA